MLNEDELKITQQALDTYLVENHHDMTESERTAAKRAYNKLDAFIDGDSIAIIWTIEDVKDLSTDDDGQPDGTISDQEARDTLRLADSEHEADCGINWGILEEYLNSVRETNDES